MKNLLLFFVFALICGTAFSDIGLSKIFKFDGREINNDEPLFLNNDDPIAYSTALAKGNPQSLGVSVENKATSDQSATLFWDDSGKEVEGTFCWDFDSYQYADFSMEDPYTLKQTITTDTETKVLTRHIMLAPEPAGLVLLLFAMAFVARKKSNG